ncbi:hypothetical protein BO78DRAFT_401121 [Aspergillus sclerotiicarbonarius CBS 121057]|uniref:Uncharacterized protein n=1 Tax=Aspergillus sclerotiicarbonarius (strain CBS 121057 / IBT 28362) TaxID=1448318 RepID=A0A319DVK7_ASPSB|nr:hypothetical protein BO78DRAFT_401121 [Aspergillus sclerotiicarbonarius CBS 121057]
MLQSPESRDTIITVSVHLAPESNTAGWIPPEVALGEACVAVDPLDLAHNSTVFASPVIILDGPVYLVSCLVICIMTP